MLRLDHLTLNDRAYATLKQGLISGDFRPGQTLVIRKLADEMGISTTPIREALQRLVAERLLDIKANRSIAVPLLSLSTFTELSRIRCVVEGLAGELATRLMGPDDIARLSADMLGMDAAIKVGDGACYLVLNEQFHFGIYGRANAPILLNMIKDLWGRIGPYFNYLMETDSYIPQSNTQHRLIIQALEQRSDTLVRVLIMDDISRAAEVLSRRLLSESCCRSAGDSAIAAEDVPEP